MSKPKVAMTDITLVGGVEVMVPTRFEYAKCKGCRAEIIWAKTMRGKNMPIRWDENEGWISHFSDCPKADSFRKEK